MGFGLLVKFLVVVVVGLGVPAALAVQYTVGDSDGWTSGADYTSWADGKTFTVGDTLLFSYLGGSHSVDVVSKSDYESCSSLNTINSFNGGNTKIPLDTAGTFYFICSVSGHCSQGMKLAVTVVSASTGSGSGGDGGSTTPPATDTSAAAGIGNLMIASILLPLAAAVGMVMG